MVPIDNITVMVQKEVADRMKVGPGSKDYGPFLWQSSIMRNLIWVANDSGELFYSETECGFCGDPSDAP